MKKLIICVLLSVAVSAVSVAAPKPEKPVNGVAKDALRDFAYQFNRATSVTWKVTEDYQKAIFHLNNKLACAMYSPQGQFLMASEQVDVQELPGNVIGDIKAKYPNFEVNDVVKVLARPADYENQDDTGSYWTALKKGNEVVYLIAAPDKSTRVVRKVSLSK